MIDTGQGSPIVLIPGLQGRWEWMTPTVEALSAHHRTFSFSLDDVDAVKAPERAFDAWVAEIDRLLDRAGEKQAAIAGVSFGGLVAAYYAARRPDRASALVLISAPAPRWRWDHPMAKYISRPRLAFPIFMAIGLSLQAHGEKLQDEQETLMSLADVIIDVFVAESAVLRAEQAAGARATTAALQADAASVYAHDAGLRVETGVRTLLAALGEGDTLRTTLAALRRLMKVPPVNTVAARRRIADAVIAKRAYLFA